MIHVIQSFGGDILKFAGDAVLVTFLREESEPKEETCLRAALCGWELSKKFNNFKTKSGEVLGCKLCLSKGDVHILRIGGVYNRWETLITGKPIKQVGELIKYTQMGEFTFDPKVAEELKIHFTFKKDDKIMKVIDVSSKKTYNYDKINHDSRIIEFAEKYIPGAILKKLQSGQGIEWLGELRKVSVIFLNIDPPSKYLRVKESQDLMLNVQKIIYKYEGSINKISIDEKGISILAAFGLPPMTHENDPHRAVYASWELSKYFRSMDLQSSIGIATGKVFCGVIGNDIRREYTVMGDTVNTAARLMLLQVPQKKDNLIFCDQFTHHETHNELIFEDMGLKQFKGKASEIKVYKPIASTSKSKIKTDQIYHSLVGRDSLKRDIRHSLYSLSTKEDVSNIEVIVIEGDPGIGKSKITEYIQHHATFIKLTTLFGSADSLEKFNPFFIWKSVFEDLFPMTENILQYNDFVKSKLIEDELKLFPLLRSVLPIDIDKEKKLNLNDEDRLDKTIQMLSRILIRYSIKNPVTILLEDLHWADQVSWKFLSNLISQKGKILIIANTRPIFQSKEYDGLTEAYKSLLNSENVIRISLENLTLEDIESIICSKLGVESVPEKMIFFVYEKSQGNPFFAEELAVELINKKAVEVNNGQITLIKDKIEAGAIPDTVQGVVTSRIDRLNPVEQLILKAASVVGRVFPTKILKEIIPFIKDEEELIRYLDALANFDLIPVNSDNHDKIYNFKHIITKEVAYNLMLLSQRKELHKKTGEVLEKIFSDNLSDHYQSIANHFFLGDSWDKAFYYYNLSGLSSMNLYAYPEARFCFTRALEAVEKLEPNKENDTNHISTILNLVSVAFVSDGPDTNLIRLNRAENLLSGMDKRDKDVIRKLADILYWRGRVHYYAGRPKEAISSYKQLLGLGEEIKDPDLMAIPNMVLGRVSAVTGKYKTGFEMLKSAVPFLEKKNMWSDWIVCVTFMGWMLGASGKRDEGNAICQKALDKATELKSNTGLAMAHIGFAFFHFQLGDIESTYQHAKDIIKFSRISGDKVYEYVGQGLVGYTARLFNQIEESSNAFKAKNEIEKEMGGKLIVSEIMTYFEGEVKLLDKDFKSAMELCNKAIHLGSSSDSTFGLGLAFFLKAKILIETDGSKEDTIDALKMSIKYHTESGSVFNLSQSETLLNQISS
jgi:class 3 adenylate cyclase/tetratricopeptide (TPR) repeat protein